MPTPCFSDTDCIALAFDPLTGLVATPILKENGGIVCTPDGLSTENFYATMYAANSGAPTHNASGGFQKVGAGGGVLTWASDADVYPGVSPQVNIATGVITIRQDGLYEVFGSILITSITPGKLVGVDVRKNGAAFLRNVNTNGRSAGNMSGISNVSQIVKLLNTDTLELFCFQDDAASEAYDVTVPVNNRLSIRHVGPFA